MKNIYSKKKQILPRALIIIFFLLLLSISETSFLFAKTDSADCENLFALTVQLQSSKRLVDVPTYQKILDYSKLTS